MKQLHSFLSSCGHPSEGEHEPGVGGEVDPQAEPHQQHLQRRSHNFLTDANRCSQQ